MNLAEYQVLAMRTAKELPRSKALLHMITGLSSEVGELADNIKKAEIYGADHDWENVAEELGDLLWFTAYAANISGMSLETIARLNIEKLQKRYPEKYTDQLALARLDKHIEVVQS